VMAMLTLESSWCRRGTLIIYYLPRGLEILSDVLLVKREQLISHAINDGCFKHSFGTYLRQR